MGAIACRRATRSSVEGWVENNLDNPLNPESGLSCAIDAIEGATSMGARCGISGAKVTTGKTARGQSGECVQLMCCIFDLNTLDPGIRRDDDEGINQRLPSLFGG